MRKLTTLTALVLFLNTLGCQKGEQADVPRKGKTPKTAQEWASQGASLRKADKKEEAIKAYDQAIKLDPNLEAAIFNRALIYAELGRDVEAAAARDKLLERELPLGKKLQGLFALNSAANVSMGNEHVHASEWDLALKKYKVALIYKPDSPEAYVGLGLVCLGQKKYDEAVAAFDRAIKRNPKSAIAYHNRGIANRERKQFKTAVADFSTALELEPANAETYLARASAYDGLGDKSRGEQDRKKGAELRADKKKEREKK